MFTPGDLGEEVTTSTATAAAEAAQSGPDDYRAAAARQRADLAARGQSTEPRVITAGYGGRCSSCGLRIEANRDQVTNALGGWAHLACSVCVECADWVTADDSVPVTGGIGRAHHACSVATMSERAAR